MSGFISKEQLSKIDDLLDLTASLYKDSTEAFLIATLSALRDYLAWEINKHKLNAEYIGEMIEILSSCCARVYNVREAKCAIRLVILEYTEGSHKHKTFEAKVELVRGPKKVVIPTRC